MGGSDLNPDNSTNIKIEPDTSNSIWPKYACLKLSSTGATGIKLQACELQVTLHCAIHKFIGWILFKDSFPSIQTRIQWNQRAMEEASKEFMDCAQEPLKGQYHTILSCVRMDPNFI